VLELLRLTDRLAVRAIAERVGIPIPATLAVLRSLERRGLAGLHRGSIQATAPGQQIWSATRQG
jgi:hypothetical protein